MIANLLNMLESVGSRGSLKTTLADDSTIGVLVVFRAKVTHFTPEDY